jgi:hypothetical protein
MVSCSEGSRTEDERQFWHNVNDETLEKIGTIYFFQLKQNQPVPLKWPTLR